MAKIYAPNKQYTGISAGVAFAAGVGETNDEHLIDWFKDHGYSVEGAVAEEVNNIAADDANLAGASSDLAGLSLDELKAYAAQKGIDIGQATTQAGILKKIAASGKTE